ncbi:MAG TPA: type II secretion system F family protein [archaeon]|nr:type II secretion system F family protein [archaeon]
MGKVYSYVYRLAPQGYKNWVTKNLKFADFSIEPERYIGFSIIYSLFLALDILIIFFVIGFPLLLVLAASVATFSLFQACLLSILILVSSARSKAVEEVLPDVLQLMAANIRSGLTPDKSLLLSARPEFGPLEVEIKKVAKRTISGEPLDESLQGMTERIDSRILNRSLKLVIEGIRKGGELASLLEQTAEDIRHTKILLKEVSAIVLMYVIFIFFAAAMAAPLLYAISTYLVETMGKIGGLLPGTASELPKQMGSIRLTRVQMSTEFLMSYSLMSLTITSIFGGLIIGLIKEGTEKAGIKFIPMFFIISIGLYFAVKMIVSSFLGLGI